jgi:hypothetical protein
MSTAPVGASTVNPVHIHGTKRRPVWTIVCDRPTTPRICPVIMATAVNTIAIAKI